MQGTVNGFSYGFVTPVAAFVMACLGAALGLRCVAPFLRGPAPWRPLVLLLGSVALGCGFWSMHFIAMTGFSVDQASVGYDRPTMFASLAVGTVMIGIGLFVIGLRGATAMALTTGGTVVGLGVASMHYLGMAGVRLRGQLEYDTLTVAGSVAVAVAAAVAALYATARFRAVAAGPVAVVALGAAATGMHYIAMAGAQVRLGRGAHTVPGVAPDPGAILPVLVGPVVFLVLAGLVMVFGQRLLGDGATPGSPGTSAGGMPSQHSRAGRRPAGRIAARGVPEPVRRGSPDLHDW